MIEILEKNGDKAKSNEDFGIEIIEKHEENAEDDENFDWLTSIIYQKKCLVEQSLQVEKDIKSCFTRLRQALCNREKQLLRQAQAIYMQKINLGLSTEDCLTPWMAVLDDREALEERIRQFGRIEIRGSNSTAITNLEPYKIAEYQETNEDHVSFDKSIKSEESTPSTAKIEFSADDARAGNAVTFTFENLNTIDSTRKPCCRPKSREKHSRENVNLSARTDVEARKYNVNSKLIAETRQDEERLEDSGRTLSEERRGSCGHPGPADQVQQWLEQILLETEVEPTIHEVEKLPDTGSLDPPC